MKASIVDSIYAKANEAIQCASDELVINNRVDVDSLFDMISVDFDLPEDTIYSTLEEFAEDFSLGNMS